jgi:hypothetical protein
VGRSGRSMLHSSIISDKVVCFILRATGQPKTYYKKKSIDG